MTILERFKKTLKIVSFSGVIVLKDGTEVQVDGNGVGAKVMVQLPNTTEPMALPDGEYTLEDDSIIVVKDGVIAEETPAPEEPVDVVTEEEVQAEEEAAAVDAPVETPTDTPTPEDKSGTTETTQPDVEKRITELEDRLKAIEGLVMSAEEKEVLTQSTQKLQSDFSALIEKLEKTDGATRVATTKKVVVKTPEDIRYENLTGGR